MTKNINIGVVGAGYWGPNLVRNFFLVENCTVKYVCDLDENKLKKIQKNFHGIFVTTKYEDLLNDPSVEAIVIATPVFTHHKIASLALQNKKHVLLEKPMASSIIECQDLINTATTNGRLLMVDHTFLYTGAVRKIKELIEKKELGDLYYFDSERINLGLIQPDVNVVWDLAPHDISIMNYLFAGARSVSVFATGTRHVGGNGDAQEMAHITVKFDSGIVGHVHVSWLSPVKIRKILIGGSKKMVIYNDIDPSEKVKIYDKGVLIGTSPESSMKPVYRSGDVTIPKLDEEEALLKEAKHFIACIGGDENPAVDGISGLDVVRILEACDRSIKEGKEIIL